MFIFWFVLPTFPLYSFGITSTRSCFAEHALLGGQLILHVTCVQHRLLCGALYATFVHTGPTWCLTRALVRRTSELALRLEPRTHSSRLTQCTAMCQPTRNWWQDAASALGRYATCNTRQQSQRPV